MVRASLLGLVSGILSLFPGSGDAWTVRYDGELPEVSGKPVEGKIPMTFMIFQSLYGGEALWREAREVEVREGTFHVDLGEKVPISLDLLTRANLLVGMRVGEGREIFPRNQLVHVVYVASDSPVSTVESDPLFPEERLSKTFAMEPIPQAKTPWEEAVSLCAAKGKRLCRYREWYSGYDAAETLKLRDLRGHYEWVQPWVYNVHHYEALNPLFQGKEDGCEFWMIAPTNGNPFRCCGGGDIAGKDRSSSP
ncbi:MAG: hypothetical protein HY760_00920 [Nitrospirae bacterium]|nr:hypothetical protein [Nitrospirota bacterium]